MANVNRAIKNVVVLGASGNIGRPIIDSLLIHPAGFKVTAVTRNAKAAKFPAGVEVVETDYSDQSLSRIFTNKDAVIASVPSQQIAEQRRFINIAVSCGVVRFLPSEFGMDTSNPDAVKIRPSLAGKVNVVDYLKSIEDKLTWTAVITGAFFDWGLQTPGGFGLNIPERKAIIYDGGDTEWEATNLDRIGEAVAASLSPDHQAIAANQFVYINSFTISQNRILRALEKRLGQKFEVTEDTTDALRDRSAAKLKENPGDYSAIISLITSALFGPGGLNQYSKDSELWNRKLGLKEESLEATLEGIVRSYESKQSS